MPIVQSSQGEGSKLKTLWKYDLPRQILDGEERGQTAKAKRVHPKTMRRRTIDVIVSIVVPLMLISIYRSSRTI